MKLGKIISILTLLFLFSCAQDKSKETKESSTETKEEGLPILGNRDVVDGDTVYHTIPDFIFLNQDSVFVKTEDLEGKIIVANFFFSTCPSICPVMTKQMKRLQTELSLDSNLVVFLSHTIDPETDTPEKLRAFAKRYEANTYNWHFLRGDIDYLYEVAKEGYLSTALIDEEEPGGFLHSSFFVLVDKEGRIRGMYDGTVEAEVDLLAKDFQILKKEYDRK